MYGCLSSSWQFWLRESNDEDFLPEALFSTKNNVVKLLRKLSSKNSHVFTDTQAVLKHYCYLLKGFNNLAMRYHKIIFFNDEQIRLVQDKALYLIGEEDPFAKMGAKADLIRHNMNVRFFKEVGHGINHEISNKINHAIIEYLGV